MIVATGKVIGALKSCHRTQEFFSFLNAIDKAVPADLDIHLIMDSYGTHKTEAGRMVRQAPALPRPLHPDFSVLALVERLFSSLIEN